VEPRQLARSLARGRIAVGAALLAPPGLARLWTGEAGGSTGAKLLARAFGAPTVE
jgi:hypothetical protein